MSDSVIKDEKFELEVELVVEAMEGKLLRHYGKTVADASYEELYKAAASTVRDKFMDGWKKMKERMDKNRAKMLYYMSAEFLLGRSFGNNLVNMKMNAVYDEAFKRLGIDIDDVIAMEADPGLGNGGLGRLAACFVESLASQHYPVMGCGIRYEYGLFTQKIVDGEQVEVKDNWLQDGCVWEVERPEWTFPVRFNGEIVEQWTEKGCEISYKDCNTVLAVAYDMPIVGYENPYPATLRLWRAKAEDSFDFSAFNSGEYVKATTNRELAESISKVLYPADDHAQGKQLRLKQFYFLASAQMQYVVKLHKIRFGDLHTLPESTVIQINDTHPTLAIPELMRILMDEEGYSWDESWDIASRVFNYTNHTILTEALECWNEQMFSVLIPRIYMIIKRINQQYCEMLNKYYPGDMERIARMAIVAFGQIRMANLCVCMTSKVNGVSQLHGDILKNRLFHDEYGVFPQKFTAITNGVTQRRWLALCNPELMSLIDANVTGDFLSDYRVIEQIEPLATDAGFQEEISRIKQNNKLRLAKYLQEKQGITLNTDAIIDVQSKRLHEYKRQLLKCIHILYKYNHFIADPSSLSHPVTYVFSAKAAPGYERAKNIIRLIHAIGDLVNNDPRTKDMMQVIFMENYSVSSAQVLIPAADISEQLSTAGYEASGTGNMKFMMNGAVTIGTMDGANVEIYDQVGPDNIYIFGASATEIDNFQKYKNYNPGLIFERNQFVRNAVGMLVDGSLPKVSSGEFSDLYQSLLFGDWDVADKYFVLYDLPSYAEVFTKAINTYANDRTEWNRKAVMNIAKSGFFSADRTTEEYNEQIWHLRKYED